MKMLRTLALLAALSTPALAQESVPYFPQTLNSGTVVGRLSSGPGPTEAIPMAALLSALFPSGIAASTFSAGAVIFDGSVSGAVTVQGQAAAGSWTLQWPTNVGASGGCPIETVSGSVATLSWVACGQLASSNTWSATNNFTGAFQIAGTVETFPASGAIVGASDTQTLTNKTINASQLTGSLPTSTLPTGQYPGVANNTTANTGNVGEVQTSTVLVASAVSLTSTAAANVTSISLGAGDWDVWGTVWSSPAGSTTSTLQQAWISSVSATAPTVPSTNSVMSQYWMTTAAGAGVIVPTGATVISLSGTTTVYLGTAVTFAVSTMKAYGTIWARRRR